MKILALSGGGSKGAFEAGIIQRLIEQNKGGWDIITGVSAGSLNAAYLASITKEQEADAMPKMKALWLSLSNLKVFEYEYFFNGLSLYNSDKLKREIVNIFGNVQPVRDVYIGATSLKKSEMVIFDKSDVLKYGYVDIIMASSAVPFIFQPYCFNGDLYVDGGLSSNVLITNLLTSTINNQQNKDSNEPIHIDVIICGTDKLAIDDTVVTTITFHKLCAKILSIIGENVEYDELRLLPQSFSNVSMTIYKETEPSPISFLDFDHSGDLWNSGYSFSNVTTVNAT